jgi:HAD superfamily hydrolase (TIGR01490 family)
LPNGRDGHQPTGDGTPDGVRPVAPDAAPIAFFDADGTLTTTTGIFGFLRHHLLAHGRDPHEYERLRHRLRTMTEQGRSREETNRAYFRYYAGADAAETAALAAAWCRADLASGHLHPKVADRLRGHQSLGHRTVIVSGSFPALLRPLADHLGIDGIHCTRPRIRDGRYTGELDGPPMIGAAKAAAVREETSARGVDPADCYAYGDHTSDLPMLLAVGRAVAVDGDPGLRREASARGWELI